MRISFEMDWQSKYDVQYPFDTSIPMLKQKIP